MSSIGGGKAMVLIGGKEHPVKDWSSGVDDCCNSGSDCCTVNPFPTSFEVTFHCRTHFIDMERIAIVADELRAMMKAMRLTNEQ